ncbi:MAG TPA: transposase [Candidatus Fournierella merdigallinarum]|nr:transposase [Candidatus Fournierella merdigallinarum]
MVVSDSLAELVAAIRKGSPRASWQRCKVHFKRNILANVYF